MKIKRFLQEVDAIGGCLPTLFGAAYLWKLNSSRMDGKFNAVFFWLYPLVLIPFGVFTVCCIIEWYFTPQEKIDEAMKIWRSSTAPT